MKFFCDVNVDFRSVFWSGVFEGDREILAAPGWRLPHPPAPGWRRPPLAGGRYVATEGKRSLLAGGSLLVFILLRALSCACGHQHSALLGPWRNAVHWKVGWKFWKKFQKKISSQKKKFFFFSNFFFFKFFFFKIFFF